MFRLLKKFFKLFKSSKSFPVTRKMVLMRVEKGKTNGLCYAIQLALQDCGIRYCEYFQLSRYFPLFTRQNAIAFGASGAGYWWPIGDWSSGREEFLNWLIEQYKDDQTDLKTI